MNQTLQHKGYTASVEYDSDYKKFFGEVIGIEDIIVFEGNTLEEAKSNLVDLIDSYPGTCSKLNVQPNSPPAEIMVPISTELYAKASCQAEHKGIPLRTLMENALQQVVS
jgi:predicted HicB family RNase H-like nuclease